MTFEEQIMEKVQSVILKQVTECRFVDYHHSKKKNVPQDIVDRAWEAVDWEHVVDNVRKEIEDKICQVIVQNMLTEVKTDVKAVLSVKGMREKIRMEAYPSIMKALNDK